MEVWTSTTVLARPAAWVRRAPGKWSGPTRRYRPWPGMGLSSSAPRCVAAPALPGGQKSPSSTQSLMSKRERGPQRYQHFRFSISLSPSLSLSLSLSPSLCDRDKPMKVPEKANIQTILNSTQQFRRYTGLQPPIFLHFRVSQIHSSSKKRSSTSKALALNHLLLFQREEIPGESILGNRGGGDSSGMLCHLGASHCKRFLHVTAGDRPPTTEIFQWPTPCVNNTPTTTAFPARTHSHVHAHSSTQCFFFKT